VPDQPAVLLEFQAGCANIISNPQQFPMLGCGKGQKRFLFTCRNRERRRERLTMMARAGAVLGAHTDLLSLSNGKRINGVCHPMTEVQIARELGIAPAAGEALEHDSTGMRALRSALRDLDDGGLISRQQPKMQYCDESAGGCGDKVPKGGTCGCGRRWFWKWRAFPTIITISKKWFDVLGLLAELEKAQGRRYGELQDGPEPERNVRIEREERRIAFAQAQAAKRVGIDPRRESREKERLERLKRLIE
jgi:hypothetical protein